MDRNLNSALALLAWAIATHWSPVAEAAQEETPAKTEQAGTVEPASQQMMTESGRRIEVVLEGLKFPTGLAIQPETGAIFVSDSGNGQVVRVENNQSVPVFVEFPLAPLAADSTIQLGPLGLLFADRTTLLVAGTGQANGEAALRRFQIPESAEPVKAEAAQNVQRFSAPESQAAAPALLYALTTSMDAFFASVVDEPSKGWIVDGKKSGEPASALNGFVEISETLQTYRPAALTISPHGYLVVGTLGELNEAADGVLAFYDAVTKKMLLRLDTGLREITAVAYSPRKQMYALDLSFSKPEEGGVFRIVADSNSPSGMQLKKIASLPHPTAMAFDAEGALLVTVAGFADGQGNRQGLVLKIPSDENL